MEKKCIYTKRDLEMLKERAVKEFLSHYEAIKNTFCNCVASGYDFFFMQQLGKELKTVDMFRTQIVSFDGYLRKYYGNESED